MKKLPRSFFSRKTITVAKELLGKIIIRQIGKTVLSGMIVETEAYLFDDPASHSFRGVTERTKVMFGPGGFLYVYFTYGMHYCANVVTYKDGIGEAVLMRAVEPLDGIDVMMKNRWKDDRHLKSDGHLQKGGLHLQNLKGDGHLQKGGLHLQNLTNGPAKFAQAFSLTTKQSGTDLEGSTIYLVDGIEIPKSKIVTTTRIGISAAKEKKLRFYIKGNRWVSRK